MINGLDGADQITGDAGSDTLLGDAGADTLSGGFGNDSLSGGVDDDQLYGAQGDDSLVGGDGNDNLVGGPGLDLLDGGLGNDTLIGSSYRDASGPDTLLGGDGNDVLQIGQGAAGGNLLDGGAGDDQLNSGYDTGGSTLVGGEGNDAVFAGGYGDVVDAGAGADNIYVVRNATVAAGDGADVLTVNYLAFGGGGVYDLGAGDDQVVFHGAYVTQATLTLGGGQDTIRFSEGAPALGFWGAITDFTAGAGGDRLEIAPFLNSLPGYDGTNPFGAGGFLRLLQDGADTLLLADRDGAAGGQAPVTLFRFQNTDAAAFTAENFATPWIPSVTLQAPTDLALDNTTIDEDASAGTLVGTLSATDPDAGDTHTFSLLNDAGGRFEIANGNEIVLAADMALDFEGQATHAIAVRVTDASGLSRDETFTITVGDVNEAPNALTLTGGTVLESASEGTVVGTLLATDPDGGDNLNLALSDDAGGLFVLVGNQIQIAAGAVLDFEASATHTVAVEVTDSGGLTLTETFTITVGDANEEPDGLVTTGNEVEENAGAGTIVATLSATDPDAGDVFTFALTDDAGGRFVVVGNEVQVAAGAVLDYETAASHDITVEVTDAGGLTRSETVTISVLDVDNAPTAILLSASEIAEDASAGTVIATLDAVDPDGGLFSFALVDDAEGRFEIVDNELRLADGAALDYEAQATHEVTVEVVDESGLSFTQSFTLTVLNTNEGPTDILVTGGTVTENASAGTLVATLDATDPDLGETFTFELVGDPSGFFEVVDNEVRVAAGALIDFETASDHVVTLRVTDSAGASYEEDLTVVVQNVAPIILGNGSANNLLGTSEEDQIFGRGGNDTLSGLEGDDQLFGEAGNDRLTGGLGTDTLAGGLNNDTYVLTDADDVAIDVIIENVGEGTDAVEVGENYSLGANLENLILTGTQDVQGTGNELNNSITGNVGNNTIDGGLGGDTMTGGLGDDTYRVDSVTDRVVEGTNAGIDEVQTALNAYSIAALGNVENLSYTGFGNFAGTGNAQANIITSGNGTDTLDGGSGADTLIGGFGDDTYVVNHVGDQVVEVTGEGAADTVRSSISYTLADEVEGLVLTGTSALSGFGNALDNAITGNTGANTLDGGLGGDTMAGGAGNDTYIVDDLGDVLTEGASQGTDTARTALLDYGMEAVANVENLSFVGTGDFTGRGNELANTLTGGDGNDALEGNAGNDTLLGGLGNDNLSGGFGADTMRGNAGNDTYFVDSALDRVIENTSQGTDAVSSSVSFTLGAYLENLALTDSAVSGTGNGLANVVAGSNLANSLSGGGGNDSLVGGGGNDTLAGGTGSDTFVFGPGFGADSVTDFDANPSGGQDFLDLTAFGIAVNDFATRVGITDVGADTLVTIDSDPSQSIRLTNIGIATTVTQQDFLL